MIGVSRLWRWISRQRMVRYEDALCRRGWYDLSARSEAEIIFIGGCSRSGTTLLREILDRHSNLVCSVETAIHVPAFETRRIAERSEIDRKILERMVAESGNLLEFSEAFFERFVKRGGATRWVDKSPHNIRVVGQLLTWFPRAVFIHIIRDGRDVVCSLRDHPRERLIDGVACKATSYTPIADCARTWVGETGLGFAQRGNPRYREVRYEGLVSDPEGTIRDLCGFFGEDFEPGMLEPSSPSGPRFRLLTNAAASGVISTGRVGRWKTELDGDEKRIFVEIAGDHLRQLEYVTDHDWVGDGRAQGDSTDLGNAAVALLRRQLATTGRKAHLTARGGCMAPLICDGDIVQLAPVVGLPRVGSVVVAEAEPDGVVCHRVQEHGPDDGIEIRGDRSSSGHEIVTSDLIGVVTSVHRGSREIELSGLLNSAYAALCLARLKNAKDSAIFARGRRALLRLCLAVLGRMLWRIRGRAFRNGG